jgi:hypothetical protein
MMMEHLVRTKNEKCGSPFIMNRRLTRSKWPDLDGFYRSGLFHRQKSIAFSLSLC